MRVVLDTNVVVSGLLFGGPPGRLLDLGADGTITLFVSAALMAELDEVLQRAKFRRRLARKGSTVEQLIEDYRSIAQPVVPAPLSGAVPGDPDDDAVLACAVAAAAEIITSGDEHLVSLASYQGIPILRPADAVARVTSP